MNFDYSDDQRFLQEEARKFLAARCPVSTVRTVLDDPASAHDPALWHAVAEMGWLGMNIPEAQGGLGLSPVDLCVIAEELGRSLAPIPFSSTVYLFTEALLLAGSAEQRRRLLPDVATGTLIGCLAATEGPGMSDPQCRVTAGRLNGTKLPVTDGMIASHAVVLATEDEAPALYLVALADAGVSRRALGTLDPTRGAAQIQFVDVPVERLGAPGAGRALLDAVADRAAVPIAFEQLGGADRCLEMARDHALQRYAFGRPIGSYQAIKHRLADIYIRNQLARSNAYYGAWALDAGDGRLTRAAAAARIAACDAYWFAAKEAIEIFGGIGTTWEADCHLFYRRAKQLALMLGGPAGWRERLVADLAGTPSN